jgi:hypothetical protein
MPIFLILLRKIKKMGIHSKYSLAVSAAKGLLRQPPFERGGNAPRGLFTQPCDLSGSQAALMKRIFKLLRVF